ncbi:MAG: alpha-L-arabinofuranosidase, partial [Bacteroidales bacterium]|nr:alpha-L-arabinofuranosidase [Bacteroidales bacterium]
MIMKNNLLGLFIVFIYPVTAQVTQGFFLDDFEPKNAVIPAYIDYKHLQEEATATATIHFNDTLAKVSKYIYGNNCNTYMTQMITEPVLIKYIKDLSPNVIRYPGGNLSNMFFWDAEYGKLPDDVPESILWAQEDYKASFWFGRNDSLKTLSVDNYYKMLEQTNSTGLICVNYSYARYGTSPNPVENAAKYAADWVRYDNGRTKFWEVGNENFGLWQSGYKIDTSLNQDGQPEIISGELYGKHFVVFADSMRAAAEEIDVDIQIGANLVELKREGNYYNPVEIDWNEGFFKYAGNSADFFSIHSYFTPYNKDSKPKEILNSAKHETHQMMEYMNIMCDEFNVEVKPVALTEWNIFAIRSKQSASYINGIHAALTLGALIENKYGMANRWNFVNRWANGDDHGMFNFGDEPDNIPRWNPRPVYFYMYYFQKYFGDHMVSSSVSGSNEVIVYASKYQSGEAGIVIINKGGKEEFVKLDLKDFSLGKRYYFHSLTGGDDHDEFSLRVHINGIEPDYITGGPISNLSNIP